MNTGAGLATRAERPGQTQASVIHLYGKQYRRFFFTIEYEGVIIISIDLLRREIARAACPITFQP